MALAICTCIILCQSLILSFTHKSCHLGIRSPSSLAVEKWSAPPHDTITWPLFFTTTLFIIVPLFHCLLFFLILADWHRARCGGQSSQTNSHPLSLGCVTWSIQNQTSFHMHLHVAARKHAASPVNFYIFLCMYASYRCQGCSRVYLHPPYHSMKWERWFVGGSGAFVWQILVNIMDLYIRNSLK